MKDFPKAESFMRARPPGLFARWQRPAWHVAAGPSSSIARRREQEAASQDWEDEGGSIRSAAGEPKIPF